MIKNPARISFTAHYTGYVWFKNGLGHPAFITKKGRRLYQVVSQAEKFARPFVGIDIETTLLQRHQVINDQIHQLIEQHKVTQILEIACGLSPRGLLLKKRYPSGLKYVEADLPAMSEHKKQLLQACNAISPEHYTVTINALASNGEDSIDAILKKHFDPTQPIIIITEGLINYFNEALVRDLWQRLGQSMQRFPKAFYLADIYIQTLKHPLATLGKNILKWSTQSNFHYLFDSDATLKKQLQFAGLTAIDIIDPNKESEKAPKEIEKSKPLIKLFSRSNNQNPLRVIVAGKK